MFNGKNVLVAGGTGMIGRYLIELLNQKGAHIRVVAIDDESLAPEGVDYCKGDLTDKGVCLSACENMDYVFNLAGIKGSPKKTMEQPASFFVPMIQFSLNMMQAALLKKVRRFLFTSSVGVYHPDSILKEDDVWKTFPSENDRFAGWAKRMGELQADAYRIEYNWDQVVIVRPANVYGRYDTFEEIRGSMVIPSLIRRFVAGENPLTVWGTGESSRDFIHAKDVAQGMIHMMEVNPRVPVNLASGVGVTIKDLVSVITKISGSNPEIVWDDSQHKGDNIRVLDISRAKSYGWIPTTSLQDGIKDTYEWYRDHRKRALSYNVFESASSYDVFDKRKSDVE